MRRNAYPQRGHGLTQSRNHQATIQFEWHEPTAGELIEQGNRLADNCMKLSLEIVELKKSNTMSATQSKAFEDSVEWNRMIDPKHYFNEQGI